MAAASDFLENRARDALSCAIFVPNIGNNALQAENSGDRVLCFLAIDFDNGKSRHRHASGGKGIRILCRTPIAGQSNKTDGWGCECGVVVAIDNQKTVIASPFPATIPCLPFRDTGLQNLPIEYNLYPVGCDATVRDGQLVGSSCAFTEYATFNSSAPVKNGWNDDVILTVNDVVMLVHGNMDLGAAPTGTFNSGLCCQYLIER